LTPIKLPSLEQSIHSVPNLVCHTCLEVAHEESFDWELDDGKDQVTNTCKRVGTLVELCSLSLLSTSNLLVALSNHVVTEEVVGAKEVLIELGKRNDQGHNGVH
jgi:hypothetical protein